MEKTSIDIIGAGNVAWHMQRAFAGIADIRMVNSRDLEGLRPDSDLYLIAVSDGAIAAVSRRLPQVEGIVAHTSGATPMQAIDKKHRKRGVFYPLQTFTKDVELDYSEIPFLIEGSDPDVTDRMCETAGLISRNVSLADSSARGKMHVAAAISSNLVNYLWTLTDRYMLKEGLDFNMMLPLIRETLRKAEGMRPELAQTGPAARGDMATIEQHKKLLEEYPETRDIYVRLSDSLMNDRQRSHNPQPNES